MKVKVMVELTIKLSKKDWAEYYYDDEIEEVTPEAVLNDLTDDEGFFADELAGELVGLEFDFKRFKITKVKVKKS
jgi:hypothetical protein